MEERTLFRISIACSIIGIIALYIFSEIIEIEDIPINKINLDKLGEKIKVKGKVNRINDFEKIFVIEIEDEKTKSKIPVVVFKDGKLELEKDNYVEITGEVKEYNGKLELISEVIKKY